MPWYIAAVLVAYTLGLLAQAAAAVERLGLKAFAVAPYLLTKVAVLFLALSYWDSELCPLLPGTIARWIVAAGAYVLVVEGVVTLKPILLKPRHPGQHDNFHLATGCCSPSCFRRSCRSSREASRSLHAAQRSSRPSVAEKSVAPPERRDGSGAVDQ